MIGVVSRKEEMMVKVLLCLSQEREKFHIIGHSRGCISLVGRLMRHCHGVTKLDLNALFASPENAVEVLQETCEKLGIDLLVPVDMPSTFLLAEIKDRLKGIAVYPCSNVAQIRQLACKLEFARLLDRLGLPQPEFWELNSQFEIDDAPWAYPVVVKPIDLEGSIGVRVCNDAREVTEHFIAQRSLCEKPLMVQQFVPGIDLCLTVLADHGKVIDWVIYSNNSAKGGGRFYRFSENSDLLCIGIRLAEALNYHGIMNFDARVREGDGAIKLVECNPRMFGSVHSAAFAGVNFVTAGVAIARGTIRPPSSQTNGDLYSLGATVSLYLRGKASACLASKALRNQQWLSLFRNPLPLLAFACMKRLRRNSL